MSFFSVLFDLNKKIKMIMMMHRMCNWTGDKHKELRTIKFFFKGIVKINHFKMNKVSISINPDLLQF